MKENIEEIKKEDGGVSTELRRRGNRDFEAGGRGTR